MNKLIATREFRHGRQLVAKDGEFLATDVDAKHYRDRGMATDAPPDEVAMPEATPPRRGRPPKYQTRQLTAETVDPEAKPE